MKISKQELGIIIIGILISVCLIIAIVFAYINRQAIYNRIMLEIIRGLFGPWI